MKKTIGICLFAAVLLIGAAVFLFAWKAPAPKEELPVELAESSREAPETEEPLLAESMKIQTDFRYVLREENGLLIVYEKDGKTVLLETNISVQHLPETAREQLLEGIWVLDEKELYDLLESYSS